MSNLKISYIDTSSVKPYEHNARKHNPSQIEMIAKSISKFGFNNPVLIDESNVLVAGHGRLEAAQSLGMETIPAITLIGLTDAEKRAYVLADNQLALKSHWDANAVASELQILADLDFDMDAIGFEPFELSHYLSDAEENDPEQEFTGMPDHDNEDISGFRKIIIHFECQQDVNDFAKLLHQQVSDKCKSLWFPEKVKMDHDQYRYE